MNEHGLSESGEHESETDDDGKLPVQQNSASAQSHGCAQRGNPKTQTDKNKIKTHLTRPASLEMTYYRNFIDTAIVAPVDYSRSVVRLASARLPKNPKSFFLETSMSTSPSKDHSSLCSFTFPDGRRCRTPRRAGHPYLCAFHARKDAQALAGEAAGKDIAYHLSGSYVSACDLSSALGRLFPAVAQGQVKPKTASTLAYLGQTLVQTLHLAQDEYINAYGTDSWRETVRHNFDLSADPPSPDPAPAPAPAPASTTPS